jgi:hypothetical protein
MSGCAVWSPTAVIIGAVLIGGGMGSFIGLMFWRGR